MKHPRSLSRSSGRLYYATIGIATALLLAPGDDLMIAIAQQAQTQVLTTTTNEAPPDAPKLPAEQLDSLVGPIALYSDPLLANGLDAVVIGHYHHPTHLRRERGEFLILGDWLARNTFARLEDGTFALRQWTEAGCRPYPAAGSPGRHTPA